MTLAPRDLGLFRLELFDGSTNHLRKLRNIHPRHQSREIIGRRTGFAVAAVKGVLRAGLRFKKNGAGSAIDRYVANG